MNSIVFAVIIILIGRCRSDDDYDEELINFDVKKKYSEAENEDIFSRNSIEIELLENQTKVTLRRGDLSPPDHRRRENNSEYVSTFIGRRRYPQPVNTELETLFYMPFKNKTVQLYHSIKNILEKQWLVTGKNDLSMIKFKYRCNINFCTFPEEYCDVVELVCKSCFESICFWKKIPEECVFKCLWYENWEKTSRKKTVTSKLATSPVTCSINSSVLPKNDLEDGCYLCPSGTERHSITSSYRDDKETCYVYESCPVQDTIPTGTYRTEEFPLKCDCDHNRCYFGVSTHCMKRIVQCNAGYEMNSTGGCVPCADFFVKPEKGCHRCVPFQVVQDYALFGNKEIVNKFMYTQRKIRQILSNVTFPGIERIPKRLLDKFLNIHE